MKLIIQIPCYNEEKTLPQTLNDLPRRIKKISKIETQVIDDGSTDQTLRVAKKTRVNHIIKFKQNKGLAAAFKAGVDNALLNGADILVNTDGDNQYQGKDIKKLVKPILDGRADVVIGCRSIKVHLEFSWLKKQLQLFGSWVLRKISKTNVEDATSGFRAYNREALLHINIFSKFSYCMETLIQAGMDNLKIMTVNIKVNPKTRKSRLYKNIYQYVLKSANTILNIFLLYRSNEIFTVASLITLIASTLLIARYLVKVMYFGSTAVTFWPTVVLAGILLVISIQLFLTGLLASLISSNRKLNEEIVYRLRKADVDRNNKNK